MKKNKGLYILMMSLLFIISALFQPSLAHINAQEMNSDKACSPNRGLDIVFVIDNSGSMLETDPSDIRIQAAKNMVNELHEYDRVSVVSFNDAATIHQSLTNNRFAIDAALDSLTPTGGTDISAGLDLALQELKMQSRDNHKIIVLLSDGHSINNTISLQLAEKARNENVRTYTIGLGESSKIPVSLLTSIAEKTGGQYFHAINANQLTTVFQKIRLMIEDLREPKIPSNWTLTKDLHMTGDLVLQENMKLDLNGYNLSVDGSLVQLSCSELRAVSGQVTAANLEQNAGASIQLNNSQLLVKKSFTQDGIVRVNGDYDGKAAPEILIEGAYNQTVRGSLDLNGYALKVNGVLNQEGKVEMGGGAIHVTGNVTQKGRFNVQQGELLIDGNLTLAGGPLLDEEFLTNRSLDVGGGVVQVGSAGQMLETTKNGNVLQKSGQLFVNHGTVRIFGDYTVKDGWLTMIKGSMDTNVADYGEGDGDYVYVHRNFSMESPRNHAGRVYSHLGTPMNDQAHLTDGVLRVDGNFSQLGDKQFHAQYSDLSQNYMQDYSRYNFGAKNRHKVLLTGKTPIRVQGSGFTFNTLEVGGRIVEYQPWSGSVKWNTLIEQDVSSEADLNYLAINDIPVRAFSPSVLNYYNHAIPSETIVGPLRELKVDARAKDHLHAKVTVMGNMLRDDGTAQVKILVTASDGITSKLYTVNVFAGGASPDAVASLEVDQTNLVFIQKSAAFNPEKATIGYRVLPTTAQNQQVNWRTLDPAVAIVTNGIVTPIGIGTTSIIAETAEGGFVKTINVEVKKENELVQGVKTLADFVENNDRYNEIMALYDPANIGIVVPGKYIGKLTFTTSGSLMSGKIETDSAVKRVNVSVNGKMLPATAVENSFLVSRMGIEVGDYVEVIAYNATGDELERIYTSYPLDYTPMNDIPPGFYSVKRLMESPALFSEILNKYAPEHLIFEAH
ncbi:VWA domain-containing protein [Sporosarcina sp. SAFN-015]|uniref:VWA domain-containing protein n=1 Tax=Sporosarcina sp. SAFN-015 TaxID=3387274 RepID=UPI003F814FF8